MKKDERVAPGIETESAEEAAEKIPDDATLGVSSLGGGPKEVPKHLVAEGDEDKSLTLLGTADTGIVADHSLIDEVEMRYPFAVWQPVKRAVNEGRMRFVDTHLSEVATEVRQGYYGGVDAAVIEAVAVGDGWFVPSTAVGATPAYVEAADRLVLEVNSKQPLGLRELHDVFETRVTETVPLENPGERIGGPRVTFDTDKPLSVVETSQEPPAYPFDEPTEDEKKIVERLTGFVQEEVETNPLVKESGVVSFEMGIGTLGNAAASALEGVDFGGTEPYYFAEVLQDGVLDLIDNGVIEDASAMSMVLSEEGKERVFGDLNRYSESIVLRPLAVSNDPDAIRRFCVVAVNGAVEVDVYGNVNSSHVGGSRLLQGIGGSADFSRNSLVSVFVLTSTVKGGSVSTVVPMVSHVDHTEHDVSVVVTEQGVADLRGLPPRERAEAIIENCAHPDYKDDLRRYVDEAGEGDEPGHIPHDLGRSFGWE
jgi:succinyl-CoA:acetate CoA-transferase